MNETVSADIAAVFPARKNPTKVYSLLRYKNQPTEAEMGLLPMHQENRTWWQIRPDGTVDKSKWRPDLVADKVKTMVNDRPLMIDLEWIWDENIGMERDVDMDVRDATIVRVLKDTQVFFKIAKMYRDAGFTGPLGFYSMAPCDGQSIYAYPEAYGPMASLELWAANAVHAGPGGLLTNADIIFPAVYPFTTDMDAWERAAVHTMVDAQAYGKPVIGLLCPHFHPSISPNESEVSAAMFTRMLDCYRMVGVDICLWGGWTKKGQLEWSEPDWWLATKQRLEQWKAEDAAGAVA